MRGKDHRGMRLLRRSRVDVEAIRLRLASFCLIAEAAEFSVKIISDRRFVAGDGFDVDELAGERDCVHADKNNAGRRR